MQKIEKPSNFNGLRQPMSYLPLKVIRNLDPKEKEDLIRDWKIFQDERKNQKKLHEEAAQRNMEKKRLRTLKRQEKSMLKWIEMKEREMSRKKLQQEVKERRKYKTFTIINQRYEDWKY
ncbi:unnamed protein product [Psylliodes chrysocephalus]|uniref:Uncharacterized protein n=1 Tax=Psylliodes chrysocephalus TaxID=3402493 RepID=A0A9P0D697_9CUCU|nr:unnamed protein product [Psylliodes chrysocephala]